MDANESKNNFINFQEKYKRFSGLIEKTPKLHLKRAKTDKSIVGKALSKNEELKSPSPQEKHHHQKAILNVKIIGLSESLKNNLTLITDKKRDFSEPTVGKLRKNKSSEHNNFKKEGCRSKIRNSKNEEDGSFIKDVSFETNSGSRIQKTPKNNKEKDIVAFVEEQEKISIIKSGKRKRKQRRLSGIYKTDLNTGFIEETSINCEDISPTVETPCERFIEEEEANDMLEDSSSNEDLPLKELNKKEYVNLTPTKSKLRKRPTKKTTEEEIIQYYTDKSIKKKPHSLETIFETPKSEPMSIKKYRRFLNFNERMSSVKIKKRFNKIRKYNLWQNTDPVSMDYFIKKLNEFEEDI